MSDHNYVHTVPKMLGQTVTIQNTVTYGHGYRVYMTITCTVYGKPDEDTVIYGQQEHSEILLPMEC